MMEEWRRQMRRKTYRQSPAMILFFWVPAVLLFLYLFITPHSGG